MYSGDIFLPRNDIRSPDLFNLNQHCNFLSTKLEQRCTSLDPIRKIGPGTSMILTLPDQVTASIISNFTYNLSFVFVLKFLRALVDIQLTLRQSERFHKLCYDLE